MEIAEYVKKLFGDKVTISLGLIWACVSKFLFPTSAIKAAVSAVLIIMLVDLLTKIYALSKQAGGLKQALTSRRISSNKFARGTLDKLVVFGVMLVICGCAYKLSIIEGIATWFTQIVFTLMFLRDVLSIIENLIDAGVSGLGPFKKILDKKMDEYIGDDSAKDNSNEVNQSSVQG